MRKDTDTVHTLKAAVARRHQLEDQLKEARADIDRLILDILKADPDMDRDDLAELADLSGTRVRAVAKEGGIPPRKRGGVRKRPARR